MLWKELLVQDVLKQTAAYIEAEEKLQLGYIHGLKANIIIANEMKRKATVGLLKALDDHMDKIVDEMFARLQKRKNVE